MRHWRRLSLRVQLLVIVAVSVLAAVGILGVTSVSYLRSTLTQGAKESAVLVGGELFGYAARARSLDDFVASDPRSLDPSKGMPKVSLSVRPEDFVVIVAGDRVHSEYRRDDAGQAALTAAQIAQLEGNPHLGTRPIRVEVQGLGPFLVMEYFLQSGGGQIWGQMYVGVPVIGVDRTVDEFIRREVLYASLLGVGMVAVASVAIFRSLRPLRRVTKIANQVAASPLSTGEVTLPDRVPPVDAASRSEADRLATSFNRMLENVETSLQTRERAERSMQRFVAEASHELRNPLAAIRGYAEYAAGIPDVPAEAAGALERVEVESARLAHLTDELLLLARLDAGRTPELGMVDLSLIVLETVSDSRVRWPDHAWRIALPEGPVEVLAADDTLRRILINLTANAGSHTPPGTRVSVSVTVEAEQWVVAVADDGPGIPPEAIPTLFDRFTQAKSAQLDVRDSGNSGLGLAIVRALADEAGYRVLVTSGSDGTIFGVEIPRTCE